VDGDFNSIYNMTRGEFEEHVAGILRFSAANSIPIVPFGAYTDDGIAITFDDGYVDVLTTVAPILARHGIPFHVFITPTKLTSGDPRYLTTAQLSELTTSELVAVGAHGYEHRPLTEMTPDDAERDLRRSRESLQDILQQDVTTMSYPFGLVDHRTRDAAERAGFTSAACSKWGFNRGDTDRLMIRRIDMWARDRRSTVTDKLAGNWNWFARLT
jgi:peptidoglycan/xylan/chitin deacetylase (PgdA/CDA1 family)